MQSRPFFLELRVRRLRWFLSMIRHPEHHKLGLASLLGGLDGKRTPIFADGGLNPAAAHPWIVQLHADLLALQDVDDAAPLFDQYLINDDRLNIRDLILNDAPALAEFDPTETRRLFFVHGLRTTRRAAARAPRATSG